MRTRRLNLQAAQGFMAIRVVEPLQLYPGFHLSNNDVCWVYQLGDTKFLGSYKRSVLYIKSRMLLLFKKQEEMKSGPPQSSQHNHRPRHPDSDAGCDSVPGRKRGNSRGIISKAAPAQFALNSVINVN